MYSDWGTPSRSPGSREISHRDEEKQMSLFFGVTQIPYLFPSFIQSNLGLLPPQGMGEEHEHHGKGSCPWTQSHDGGVLFVGGTGFRYRAVSTWSESKSSQLSHGKRQTRKFDKSVMLWRFPLKMDNQHAFSRWTGLYYFVPNVDIGCDPWLLPGRRIIDIRWDPLDHSPSSHREPSGTCTFTNILSGSV